MARRKKESVHVPADAAEATTMVAEYVELDRERALERLVAENAIDLVKGQRDNRLAELDAEAKPLFEGLKAFWESGGSDEFAKGKKSAEVANAQIGHRTGMPKLKLKRGVTIGRLVEWLKVEGFVQFLRVPNVQLDKNAVIKELREDGELAPTLTDQGASVEQAEEFFIDTSLDEGELKKEIAAS